MNTETMRLSHWLYRSSLEGSFIRNATLEDWKQLGILVALHAEGWNKMRAARRLDITVRSLHRYMDKYGIPRETTQ